MDDQKRNLANKNENAAKKWNVGEIGMCDEKDEDVSEEMTLAKNHQMNSEIFHRIESAKDKILAVDPNLGIWQFAKE